MAAVSQPSRLLTKDLNSSNSFDKNLKPTPTPLSPPLCLSSSSSEANTTYRGSSHHSSPSVTSASVSTLSSSPPAAQRSTGIFALAVSALDKTLAGISEPRVRSRQSLSRISIGPDSALASVIALPSPDRPSPRTRNSSSYSSASNDGSGSRPAAGSHSLPVLKDPPSQRYTETDPTRPPPVLVPRLDNKMHQTSSRLLRMTDDDRPFTKVSQQHCPRVLFFPLLCSPLHTRRLFGEWYLANCGCPSVMYTKRHTHTHSLTDIPLHSLSFLLAKGTTCWPRPTCSVLLAWLP